MGVLTSRSLSETFGLISAVDLDLLKAGLIKLGRGMPRVVEIGTGAGTATLAILEACASAELYSIDIKKDSSGYVRGRIQAAMLSAEKVHFLIGDSHVLCTDPRWIDNPIDFLFLDGDHSDAGIIGDLQGWVPLMATKGVIAVHDYGAPGTPWGHAAEVVDVALTGMGWRRVAMGEILALFARKKASK